MTISRVNVNVPRSLAQNIGEIRDEAKKLREDIGGMGNDERAKLYGGFIGQSNVAFDPFDGKINRNDENQILALAMQSPTGAFKALAAQGAEDPGIGVLHRSDDASFLQGKIKSMAVIKGTASKGEDGSKVKGDGADLSVQVEYQATRGETRRVLDVMGRDAVRFDEENGKPKNISARLNVDGKICEDGIRDIHFSAKLDHMPAVDAMKLLAELGSEEVEFPAALPLQVMMQAGAQFSMEFMNGKGNVALHGDLVALNELDDSDRIPSAIISANADGAMETHDGKQFLDLGTLDVSLDSKMNILWDDKGKLSFEIQDENGKYQKYDTGKLGMSDVDEKSLVFMLMGAMAGGLDG
jgi:hypothetical protein